MTRLRQIYAKRDVIHALVRRNFLIRYKQSILGPLWVVLQPVLLTFLFSLVYIIMGAKESEYPYPLLLFSGLIPWTFFSNAMLSASGSIVDNAPIIKKIYCPREIFPLASVLTSCVDILIAMFMYVVLLLAYSTPIPAVFTLVSVLVPLHALFIFGLALGASSIAVYRRDVIIGMPLIMQVWMFASPVFYPYSSIPDRLKPLFLLNPMTGFVEAYRSVLLLGIFPSEGILISMVAGTAVSVFLGTSIFRGLEQRFADVI